MGLWHQDGQAQSLVTGLQLGEREALQPGWGMLDSLAAAGHVCSETTRVADRDGTCHAALHGEQGQQRWGRPWAHLWPGMLELELLGV